jgi:hypothetical protein
MVKTLLAVGAIVIELALQHASHEVGGSTPTVVGVVSIRLAVPGVTGGIATEGTILFVGATIGHAGGSDGTALVITVIDAASGRTAAVDARVDIADLPQGTVCVV